MSLFTVDKEDIPFPGSPQKSFPGSASILFIMSTLLSQPWKSGWRGPVLFGSTPNADIRTPCLVRWNTVTHNSISLDASRVLSFLLLVYGLHSRQISNTLTWSFYTACVSWENSNIEHHLSIYGEDQEEWSEWVVRLMDSWVNAWIDDRIDR